MSEAHAKTITIFEVLGINVGEEREPGIPTAPLDIVMLLFLITPESHKPVPRDNSCITNLDLQNRHCSNSVVSVG